MASGNPFGMQYRPFANSKAPREALALKSDVIVFLFNGRPRLAASFKRSPELNPSGNSATKANA